MELTTEMAERVGGWDLLSQWERSELGKDLRRLGLSYGEIMDLIPVKKSTLAYWSREVELTVEQIAALKERTAQVPGLPVNTQWRRRLEIERIRSQAAFEASQLVVLPFWTAGVALYWGEGAKATKHLSLANADPAALRLFKAWSTEFLPPHSGWGARINLHADNDEPKARHYWSAQLDVELDDFTKSYVKPDGTGHRKNHLAYGVCTLIKRKSADAYHTTMAWIEFLQSHYGG